MLVFAHRLRRPLTLSLSIRKYYNLDLNSINKPATVISNPFSSQVHSKASQDTRSRPFSSTSATMAAFPTPSSDPPKHQMAYFPQISSTLPSKNTEFRRVLWTGLYSQLVLMHIPVGGEIGDEVRYRALIALFVSLVQRYL